MNRITRTLLTAAVLAVAIASGSRAGPTTLSLSDGSKLWLEGKSTLHPFESTATKLLVDMILDRADSEDIVAAVKAGKPAKLTVTIPIASMKSKHSGLDGNMHKALRADKYPDIVFAMDKYSIQVAEKTTNILASGTLTLAGVSKPVTLNAALTAREGRLFIDGEQPILMTDYGIKPPTMMFGRIKTEDQVVIKYHLELAAGL